MNTGDPGTALPARPMRKRVVLACRLCAVGCGTIVELDGDRVTAATGDFSDPWSAGYTCAKGRAGGVFHNHPDRFDDPLIRRGGALVACSGDEASRRCGSEERGVNVAILPLLRGRRIIGPGCPPTGARTA